ncbi:MAG: HepT-like ribonuclease domain-containing protein [Saprospiraceae bacterium]|jgi:uncharacterized protein with HEPN domain
MRKKILKWLLDVQVSVEAIRRYLGEEPTFEDFLSDRMMRKAVEREFEIIGEAVNRILKQQPDIAISNARKIVDFRNHISHVYDNVSEEIMWGIIVNYLPELHREVLALIEEHGA